ncbi:serpin peptidase inhibitor, clade B (ovalbumin), member 1, like 3 isoform X3 [Genypterus blacodes]|uniref:serpin peptidase inhibitor, clade B (ovalbumin), member 1, like 3 isoform X3 n=1 Tax=Genypterus blacodes TaxID=154954 RepID=UPI003F75C2A8
MATSNSLSKANTSFSLALFKKLSEDDKTGNVFYSPFSISSALAMVLLGARGNTATQMSEVLHFIERDEPKTEVEPLFQRQRRMPIQIQQRSRLPFYLQKMIMKAEDSEDDVHEDFAQVMSEIIKPGAPYALSLANRLYGEQTCTFVEDFLAKTRKHYNAELESVDFSANAEEARLKINSWVEEQTQEKIKDLLTKNAVNSLTKLVLVNAIYFKGNWKRQFKEEFTQDATFRLNKNETKSVKMMFQKAEFPFSMIPEANCKILELTYEGNDLSMLIILPDDIEDETTGLEKLEKELTYELFVEWTRPDAMSQVEVQVKLPRFKMEEQYDLGEVLVSMGMVDAFDILLSDFSGMSTANDLFVSKVVHKSFVEVNEEGTEAAAATAAVMATRSIKITPSFYADHPFLFYIRHNPTMTILFAGRYSTPA